MGEDRTLHSSSEASGGGSPARDELGADGQEVARPPLHKRATVLIFGRVGVDLYPTEIETPLSQVSSFRKYVGGFAGNVATGIARLGVPCAVLSAVGDDGHGVFIREWLESQGVECEWLGVDSRFRTPLAFCEVWPPDRFPLTFYRGLASTPDWHISIADVDLASIAAFPLVVLSGSALAAEPSRTVTLAIASVRSECEATTIFDLDWRPAFWSNPAEYAALARIVANHCDVLVGATEEFTAANLDYDASPVVVLKRGADGCVLRTVGGDVTDVPGLPVDVVNGLGAGDAFLAAFTAAMALEESFDQAAHTANAAGALVATRLACSEAMPTLDELKAFLESTEKRRRPPAELPDDRLRAIK